MDTPFYALIEEAAPHLARVGEEGLFCAFKCSRFVVRVLGIDVGNLGEAGIHAHLVDDDVLWPRWRCDIQAASTTVESRRRRARRLDDSNLLADAGGLGPGVRAREFVSERWG